MLQRARAFSFDPSDLYSSGRLELGDMAKQRIGRKTLVKVSVQRNRSPLEMIVHRWYVQKEMQGIVFFADIK
jgi:hypothetical protein